MANKKELHKQLKRNFKQQEKERFENSLPADRSVFLGLFDYLDEHLQECSCDHSMCLTEKFLVLTGMTDTVDMLDWLADHGAFCDCEVLANVEELFE